METARRILRERFDAVVDRLLGDAWRTEMGGNLKESRDRACPYGYVLRALDVLVFTTYWNAKAMLLTAWQFDIRRLGVLILLLSMTAGFLELPTEQTEWTIYFDRMWGSVTLPLILFWSLTKPRRSLPIVIFLVMVLVWQAAIALLSAMTGNAPGGVDEMSMVNTLLAVAVAFYQRMRYGPAEKGNDREQR